MVNSVARIERSEIRGLFEASSPDFAALYPGYRFLLGKKRVR